MFQQGDIQGTDVLDHLGLVAATVDKLGIVKEIDKRLPMTKSAKTTYGQRAMAMILNGLGFMDDRLYLFPKFLDNKPIARLFGKDLCANDFNDDALGRFLDAVHEYGENKLFSEIAVPIALKHNLLSKSAHFDTTTLTVYGEYSESSAEEDEEMGPPERLTLSKRAHPDYGHAKKSGKRHPLPSVAPIRTRACDFHRTPLKPFKGSLGLPSFSCVRVSFSCWRQPSCSVLCSESTLRKQGRKALLQI